MNKITPSESLTKMQGFIERVDRLTADEYSNKRFATYDLTKLKHEIKFVPFWYSIALFNKNKERADSIIKECKEKYKLARSFVSNID